jgi:hypothetical protein
MHLLGSARFRKTSWVKRSSELVVCSSYHSPKPDYMFHVAKICKVCDSISVAPGMVFRHSIKKGEDP